MSMHDLYAYVSVYVKACMADSLPLIHVSKPLYPISLKLLSKGGKGVGEWESGVNCLFVSTLFHRMFQFHFMYEVHCILLCSKSQK